jgi:hypothetical protein
MHPHLALLIHLDHHVLTDLKSRATHLHRGLPHCTMWSPISGAVLMSVTGCDTGCCTQDEHIIWWMASRDRTRELLVVCVMFCKDSSFLTPAWCFIGQCEKTQRCIAFINVPFCDNLEWQQLEFEIMECPRDGQKPYTYIYIYIYICIHTSPRSCIWLTLHSPISGAVYIETEQGSSVFQLLVSSLAHLTLGRLIMALASILLNHSAHVCLCLLVEEGSTVGVPLLCGTASKGVYVQWLCLSSQISVSHDYTSSAIT